MGCGCARCIPGLELCCGRTDQKGIPKTVVFVLKTKLLWTFEMFLGILLASLSGHVKYLFVRSREKGDSDQNIHTFAGFPTFWPITFHLLASYSLIASRRAIDYA